MSKPFLLERIGGDAALQQAVEAFYERVTADKNLEKFFEGADIHKLKKHQYRFLRMAFTKVPTLVNVPKMMKEKHAKLFAMGLNETHFDLVAGHLVGALKSLGVADELINEAFGTISPLRVIFEEEGAKARQDGGPTKGNSPALVIALVVGLPVLIGLAVRLFIK